MWLYYLFPKRPTASPIQRLNLATKYVNCILAIPFPVSVPCMTICSEYFRMKATLANDAALICFWVAAAGGTHLDCLWNITHSSWIHTHKTSHLRDNRLCVFESEKQLNKQNKAWQKDDFLLECQSDSFIVMLCIIAAKGYDVQEIIACDF